MNKDRQTILSENYLGLEVSQREDSSLLTFDNTIDDAIDNKNKIAELKRFLDQREWSMLEASCGLGKWNGKACTLTEMSVEFGVSRERVRQIVMRGIRKLRRHAGVHEEIFGDKLKNCDACGCTAAYSQQAATCDVCMATLCGGCLIRCGETNLCAACVKKGLQVAS